MLTSKKFNNYKGLCCALKLCYKNKHNPLSFDCIITHKGQHGYPLGKL